MTAPTVVSYNDQSTLNTTGGAGDAPNTHVGVSYQAGDLIVAAGVGYALARGTGTYCAYAAPGWLSGGSGTWTELSNTQNGNSGLTIGYAVASASGSGTVEVTLYADSDTSFINRSRVWVFRNYGTFNPGTSSAIVNATSSTNNISPSITRQGTDSLLIVACVESLTGGNPTSSDLTIDSPADYNRHMRKQTTGTGAATVNLDASGTGTADWRYSILEIPGIAASPKRGPGIVRI